MRLLHVSAGVNRICHAVDWGGDPGSESLIAYGAHNAVMIYNYNASIYIDDEYLPRKTVSLRSEGGWLQDDKLLFSIAAHQQTVTCVRWVPRSGSADGSIKVWQVQSPAALKRNDSRRGGCGSDNSARQGPSKGWTPPYQLLQELQGPGGGISNVCIHPLGVYTGGFLLAATTSAECLGMWEAQLPPGLPASYAAVGGADLLRGAVWKTIELPKAPCMQLCVAMADLPYCSGWVVIALGGSDGCVRVLLNSPVGDVIVATSLSGHQDWVKALDLTVETIELDASKSDGSLSCSEPVYEQRLVLAAASQDKCIRVWTLDRMTVAAIPLPQVARFATRQHFFAGTVEFIASPAATLQGHEDWVHCLRFKPRLKGRPPWAQGPLEVLSCSMDRSMIIWRQDSASGLWMAEESFGDAGVHAWTRTHTVAAELMRIAQRNPGAAGAGMGSSLGYYTCCWAPAGDAIVSHGYTGALHIWQQQQQSSQGFDAAMQQDTTSMDSATMAGPCAGTPWEPKHACTGHYGAVTDLVWAYGSDCLISVAEDQTARITVQDYQHRWFELARPQVHGHNMSCVAAVPAPSTSSLLLYASGSEEKVVRVFQGPTTFLTSFEWAQQGSMNGWTETAVRKVDTAKGAVVSALGLSNQALYDEDDDSVMEEASMYKDERSVRNGPGQYAEGPDIAPAANPRALTELPLEEHLCQSTLWPEIQKLYGHGNDVYCLAADPLGQYIVSACRAQSAETAALWVWRVADWQHVGTPIPVHELTVTSMKWSPDGQWLLTSSRDRSLALLHRSLAAPQTSDGSPLTLVWRQKKAHSRIIWDVSWTPCGRFAASCCRDGTVKLWELHVSTADSTQVYPGCGAAELKLVEAATSDSNGNASQPFVLGPMPSAVTTVAFCPSLLSCIGQIMGQKEAQVKLKLPSAPLNTKQTSSSAADAAMGEPAAADLTGGPADGHTPQGSGGKGGLHAQQIDRPVFVPTTPVVALVPSAPAVQYLLACGCESGALYMHRLGFWAGTSGPAIVASCIEMWHAPPWARHVATVRRLAFKCSEDATGGQVDAWLLASCGDDHALRVFACPERLLTDLPSSMVVPDC